MISNYSNNRGTHCGKKIIKAQRYFGGGGAVTMFFMVMNICNTDTQQKSAVAQLYRFYIFKKKLKIKN